MSVTDTPRESATTADNALAYEGNLMEASQIDVLASLPTYDEAVSKLMSVIQGATSKLARTLAAIRDQKEQEAA
jgi:large subunit ribosomal protein L10